MTSCFLTGHFLLKLIYSAVLIENSYVQIKHNNVDYLNEKSNIIVNKI